MIYLTGDVHNSNPTQDPGHGSVNEPSAALDYARMAAEEGVQTTLFVTGRALLEQRDTFWTIQELGNVEFGGHGWDSFNNPRLRTAMWSAFGSLYGPRWYQAWEVNRTIEAFRTSLGIVPTSWRNHAYYTDENTYSLLEAVGIRVVSDRNVAPPFAGQIWAHQTLAEARPGLWSLPINTSPDHDGLVHPGITQASADAAMAKLRGFRDLDAMPSGGGQRHFGVRLRRGLRHLQVVEVMPWSGNALYAGTRMELREPVEWENRLYCQIEDRLAAVGFAVLLVHPVCMMVLDRMAMFRRILSYCARYSTALVSEALPG